MGYFGTLGTLVHPLSTLRRRSPGVPETVPQVRIADTEETFTAEDGETVLAAAQRAGLPFPYSCQAGNCGSCKCELVEGDTFALDASEYALSPAEQASGLILACRTQVWGDTTIRRLADDDIVMHPSRILRCRVIAIEQSTHDVRTVRLASDETAPFIFSPGQYSTVEFAPGFAKHYSMANTPDDPVLEFQVRRMSNGRTSAYVAERLAVGDVVTVSGPHGTAYWREKHVGPVLMIAGGTGLAPLQSILRAMLAANFANEVKLYFGVRAERDVYNESLLADLAARHPNFSFEIVLSDGGATARRSGFVHDAVAADLPAVAGWKAYLAGPPVMVEAATELLKSRGMAMRDIHADAYYDQP